MNQDGMSSADRLEANMERRKAEMKSVLNDHTLEVGLMLHQHDKGQKDAWKLSESSIRKMSESIENHSSELSKAVQSALENATATQERAKRMILWICAGSVISILLGLLMAVYLIFPPIKNFSQYAVLKLENQNLENQVQFLNTQLEGQKKKYQDERSRYTTHLFQKYWEVPQVHFDKKTIYRLKEYPGKPVVVEAVKIGEKYYIRAE